MIVLQALGPFVKDAEKPPRFLPTFTEAGDMVISRQMLLKHCPKLNIRTESAAAKTRIRPVLVEALLDYVFGITRYIVLTCEYYRSADVYICHVMRRRIQ